MIYYYYIFIILYILKYVFIFPFSYFGCIFLILSWGVKCWYCINLISVKKYYFKL